MVHAAHPLRAGRRLPGLLLHGRERRGVRHEEGVPLLDLRLSGPAVLFVGSGEKGRRRAGRCETLPVLSCRVLRCCVVWL